MMTILTSFQMGLRNRTLLTDERCFFITTTCYHHIPLLYGPSCFRILFDSFRFYNEKYCAKLIAYVFMPNHIHFVIFFEGDNRLIEYMRDFKKFTARQLREHLRSNRPDLLSQLAHESNDQQCRIWTGRYDDVYLYSRQVCETKIDYIHSNPVRGRLVAEPAQYAYSSAAFYEGLRPHSALLHYRELF